MVLHGNNLGHSQRYKQIVKLVSFFDQKLSVEHCLELVEYRIQRLYMAKRARPLIVKCLGGEQEGADLLWTEVDALTLGQSKKLELEHVDLVQKPAHMAKDKVAVLAHGFKQCLRVLCAYYDA